VLTLARKLKAMNWPEADGIAETMILHIERDRR
jgi:hypothetical protein